MKKIFLLLFLFLFFIFSIGVNADSDYENDYTLIDCVNGDNNTGIAFDSTMPYATLKEGIEKTIAYINININKVGNEDTASGLVLNIKVACSFDDIFNKSIALNFYGVGYNNELIIEGIDDNSFIIKETDFKLGHNAGNITFKNAQFRNENKPYFYDYIFTASRWEKIHPFSNGIKIINSYIQLKNGLNIGNYESYKFHSSHHYNSYSGYSYETYIYPYNYVNNHYIENSVLDIEIDNNFSFRMPLKIKNSKINFNNLNGSGTFDISFLEEGNTYINIDLNYSVFVSNEIDLGGNNFKTEDTTQISFLNNKFTNFNTFDFSGKAVFINNYIENNESIDISDSHNLFNNVLKSGFMDSYDIINNRRNFAENNIVEMGLGWVYKRIRDLKFFNIDFNSADLYKEVTGKVFPKGLGDIYIIFNY